MKEFLLNNDSHLFLYVCNMFPKDDELRFYLPLIKDVVSAVIIDNGLRYNAEDVLQVLYSSDYSDNLSKIHNLFQKTNKLFRAFNWYLCQ